jgi:hypothetical protein
MKNGDDSCFFVSTFTNKIQYQSNPGKTNHLVASQNIFVMLSSGVFMTLSCNIIKCGDRVPLFHFFPAENFHCFCINLITVYGACVQKSVLLHKGGFSNNCTPKRCLHISVHFQQMHYKTTFSHNGWNFYENYITLFCLEKTNLLTILY